MYYDNGYVNCTLENYIAVLTFTNPPMNALSSDLITGIEECLKQLEKDEVRCLILTGGDSKAFVAGADIKEMPGLIDNESVNRVTYRGQAMTTAFERFKAPVIAALNGHTLGGGLEIALGCDIRLASEKARLGLPEVTLGIIPGYGGTQRLCKAISLGEAKRMIYTGAPITALKAKEIGLVQEVYVAEDLMPAAFELAKAIAANAPIAVHEAKKAVDYISRLHIDEGLEAEAQGIRVVFQSEDHNEGIDAFIQKRTAVFQNR